MNRLSEKGWIKLHRKIQEHWLWQDKPFDRRSAWIDILMLANHEDRKVFFENEIIHVKRGEFISSEPKLAERWGWSRTKVRNFLTLLEKDCMILNKKEGKKRTRIIVLNYNEYQEFKDNEKTIDETTGEQDEDKGRTREEHKQELKNLRIKELKNIEEDSSTTLSKEVLNQIIKEWNQLGLQQLKGINKNTNRYSMLKARISEYSLNEVIQAIKNIDKSSFLKGQNKRGWVITFDWLIRPNNFIKVLEGNYTDRDGGEPNGKPKRDNGQDVDQYAGIGLSFEDLQQL